MPKKQDGYDDALGSIFDFVFANNKSKKSRGIPYKPSGASGTDELTRALADIVAMPGAYMADAAINNVNETFLDPSLVEVYLDVEDEKKYKFNYDPKASRYRVRLSDLGKAMSNPKGFVDGIDKKIKQQRAWVRLTGASATLDSAAAIGIGLKNGMTTQDAMTFGKGARLTYDSQMRELQKEVIAGNAAAKAAFERAKSKARSEGLDPRSVDYERRVFELARGATTTREDDTKFLYEAMRSTKTARRENFLSESQLGAAKADVEAYLRKKIGYRTVDERERVDSLVSMFEGELKQNGGESISGYRRAYARNQHLQAQLSTSQNEIERHVLAGNLAHSWDTIKGDGEYADLPNIMSGRIKGIDEEIKKYENLARNDPRFNDIVVELKGHKANLQRIQGEQMRKLNRSGEYWRNPNTPFAPRAERKLLLAAAEESIKADIVKLQGQIDQTDDLAEKRLLMMDRDFAVRSLDRLKSVPGSELRNNLDSYISTYNVFTAGILQGGIGRGLIDGSSYHQKGAAAMFAPGTITTVSLDNRNGFLRDSRGKYQMINRRRLRRSGNFIVDEKGNKYTFSNNQMFDAAGNVLKDKNGNVLKFDFSGDMGYTFGGIVVPRDEANIHYSRLAGLYYLTPTSMLKTMFWNGEGYAYLGLQRQLSVQRAFSRDRGGLLTNYISSNAGLFNGISGLFDPESGNLLTGKDFTDGLAGNYSEILAILSANQSSLPDSLRKVLLKANSKLASRDRYLKMADFLSDKIAGKWASAIGVVSDKIKGNLKGLIEKLIKEGALKENLKKFVDGSIGLKQVIKEGIRSAVLALANAIGFATTGGLANFLISAVAWVGTEAVMTLTKPLFGIALMALWGVCGLLGVVIMQVNMFTPNTVAHANMSPLDLAPCGVELYPDDLPPQNPDLGYGDAPHDGICPISVQSVCTQGPTGRFSHARMGTMAIDISGTPGYWRAPSDGRVTQVVHSVDCGWDRGKSSGGLVWFTDVEGNEYRLLHVVPLVGTGPVTQGTPIARMSMNLPKSSCWTGPHYHLDTKANGGWVNSLQWYRDLGCNISCP